MHTTDTLLLAYRPELLLLTARWLAEPTLPQLHADYAAILHAGQRHGSIRWLLDVRRRPTPTPALANWVAQEWLPQAVAALAPRRLRIAYLMSPVRADAMRLEPSLQPSIHAAVGQPQPFDLTVYMDEGPAMQWLLT